MVPSAPAQAPDARRGNEICPRVWRDREPSRKTSARRAHDGRIHGARARHGQRESAPCETASRSCSVYGTLSSHLPTRMHGGDSPGKITILHLTEARFPDQLRTRPLRRKPPDAFGRIAIGLPVAGHDLAEPGQHRKGIKVIEPIEPWGGHA